MKRIKIAATFVLTLVLLQFQGALPAHAENFFFNCGGGGTYTVDQPSGVLLKSDKCAGYVKNKRCSNHSMGKDYFEV
jgi:hypothetical protein